MFINKNYSDLKKIAVENSSTYLQARPFPSIVFDNFFDEEDFNWSCRDELVLKFPLQKDIIERLHYRSEKSSM